MKRAFLSIVVCMCVGTISVMDLKDYAHLVGIHKTSHVQHSVEQQQNNANSTLITRKWVKFYGNQCNMTIYPYIPGIWNLTIEMYGGLSFYTSYHRILSFSCDLRERYYHLMTIIIYCVVAVVSCRDYFSRDFIPSC